MDFRPTQQDWERRELLADHITEAATLAALIKDTQPILTAEQRGALEFLLRATQLVRERFGQQPAREPRPLPWETLARAMAEG